MPGPTAPMTVLARLARVPRSTGSQPGWNWQRDGCRRPPRPTPAGPLADYVSGATIRVGGCHIRSVH
jgi:hypothetical protein